MRYKLITIEGNISYKDKMNGNMIAKLKEYSPQDIITAVNVLGIESLFGVSEIYPHEVYEFVDMLNEYEAAEIVNTIKNQI